MPGNPRSTIIRNKNPITGSPVTIRKIGASPAEQVKRDMLARQVRELRKKDRRLAKSTLELQSIVLSAIKSAGKRKG